MDVLLVTFQDINISTTNWQVVCPMALWGPLSTPIHSSSSHISSFVHIEGNNQEDQLGMQNHKE
jgi:hypothetical protein